MEIDITQFKEAEAFTFSHSQAEGGDNAGRNTWNAAKASPVQLLKTEAEKDAFRRHIAEFGAWSREEIAAFDESELNGLFTQLIAGDIREAGADTLEGINWKEYRKQVEAGQAAGNIFKHKRRYYYTLSY